MSVKGFKVGTGSAEQYDFNYLDNKPVIDSALSSISENAVQNKVVKATLDNVDSALENKAEIDGYYEDLTAGNAEQLVATVGVTDKVPYVFRTSGGAASIGNRETDKLVGGTIAWNQLCPLSTSGYNYNSNLTSLTIDSANKTFTFKSAGASGSAFFGQNAISGHRYLIAFDVVTVGDTNGFFLQVDAANDYSRQIKQTGHYEKLISPTSYWRFKNYDNTQNDTDLKNLCIFDLTQMFGSAVADYVYSLEQANAGAGVAWFRRLFPKPYYAYNAGQLMSVKTSSHDMVGFNAYDHSTGKAHVVGGNIYQITGAYTALSLNGESITPDASGYFTPAADGELTVTGGDSSTTCVHLTWSGYRDGEYEPYVKHTYALDSDLTLRGIPKLDADNRLYYDGDTYASDGTVTRKYGIVDLGTLTWAQIQSIGPSFFGANVTGFAGTSNAICSKYPTYYGGLSSTREKMLQIYSGEVRNSIYINDTNYTDAAAFKTAMNGVYLVYELATPTAESADPYQNPQIVDDFGTEEYVDTRDVPVPVGHDTFYQNNLRDKLQNAPESPNANGDYIMRRTSNGNAYVALPSAFPSVPSSDGTYVLKATVSGGTTTLAWVAE